MANHTRLRSAPEFDRVRRAWAALGDRLDDAGDDCAFVELAGQRFALSCDLSVEGTHFRTGWLQASELGWRATAAALSDLAAVASRPLGVLVSVAIPREWPDEHFGDLMEGVGNAAQAVGARVWGGDLVRGEAVAIDVFVMGALEGEPVRRRGARPGDELWVTGALGGPLRALAAWSAGVEPEETARARFAHPQPRVAEALWLKERGARAMIDVSDGLMADAEQLAAASGVGWSIEADLVPRHPLVDRAEEAVASGEEYELLVALPAGGTAALGAEFQDRFALPITRIGTADDSGTVRAMRAGRAMALPPAFAHF